MAEKRSMQLNGWARAGIVLAGYALALFTSVAAVAVYDRRFTPADNATMGGMIAGGEMMYGCGVFLFLSLAPTALALWFLRASRIFWSGFSAVVLGFAALGFLSAAVALVTRSAPSSSWLALFAFVGLMQMLSSPLWIGGFALFALCAPERVFRKRILLAAGIELLVAGCAALHFLTASSI
jgi:hypothetical protein